MTKTRKGGGGASRRGSHRLSDSSGCSQRWKYSLQGLKSTASNYYMDFGTLLHTGLAYHYVRKMDVPPQWFLDYPDEEAALVEDALGYDDRLRKVKEILAAYKRYWAGENLKVLFCEQELETTLGAIDPDCPDEPGFEIEYTDERTKEKKVKVFPRLRDELLTCRPDLIIERNGHNWIWDHKTAGAARNGSGRLPVMNTKKPDYAYGWQAMFNMLVVRASMPITGFVFNRVKRDPPYDFAQDSYDCNPEMYGKMPRAVRKAVRAERQRSREVFEAEADIIDPNPWECSSCSYFSLCYAESADQREYALLTEFETVEEETKE